MDNLRCNRLTCRRALAEKAVVTTCSHIFCVECANELFNATRLCPACDTSLTEPDDVVVCSLRPSNDYKTSVLSGLNPAVIIEICGRALSFWQYQVHQEHSFQQAVIRNVNEKNAQLQKELGNVVREANGELSILNNKVSELERELELERRKTTSFQESLKDREKEYQKLKAQLDKIKRKALLNPNPLAQEGASVAGSTGRGEGFVDHNGRLRAGGGLGTAGAGLVDVGAVVNGMEASGIQRTPIINRTLPQGAGWRSMNIGTGQPRQNAQRRPFNGMQDRSFRSASGSEGSLNEVEGLLGGQPPHPVRRSGAWQAQGRPDRAFAPTTNKRSNGGFRPAGTTGMMG